MTHPIHAAAKPYLSGWRYGHGNRVAYPWPRAVQATAVAVGVDEQDIDCTTLAASTLMRAYPEAPWDQHAYEGLQIARRPIVPDDPIRAVVAVGVGVRVDAFLPERWHLVQGVTQLDPFRGHAFLAYSRGNTILDLLESTSRENGKGPRFRATTAKALHDGKGGGQFPAALFIAVLVER